MSTFVERPRYQCALGGALVTINAMERAAAIVHASPGCAAAADGAAAYGSGYWGSTANDGRATPSTNIVEKEIIFGGEERLAEQIAATLDVVDADLFAVLTGCMTDIIGDDVRSVVQQFQARGKSVVFAETGGFKGDSSVGYELLWEALARQHVEATTTKNPRLVNLLGFVPAQDVFWRGNLLELKRLLEALGFEVNAFLTPFDRPEALKTASSAALNLVFSDVHGHRAARAFVEEHSVPWTITPLPIGPTATASFLRGVAARFDLPSARVDALLEAESRWYYQFLNPLTDLFTDQDFQRFAVVVGNADYAYAVTKFVTDDLGWIPYATVVTDQLDEDEKARVLARFDESPLELRPKVLFETDTSRIQERVLDAAAAENDPYGTPLSPAFVLGSTLDRPLAAELKAGFWSVSYPITNRAVTDQSYVGYRGGLRLATEIVSVLLSNR